MTHAQTSSVMLIVILLAEGAMRAMAHNTVVFVPFLVFEVLPSMEVLYFDC